MAQRDALTAAHWTGRVNVVVYPPPARSGLPSVEELAERFLRRPLQPGEWGALVGAPDRALVEILPDASVYGPALRVRATHPWLDGPALRYLYRDPAGRLAIRNERLDVRDEAPEGVATRMLAHQVRAAQQLGVAYLSAEAAGGPGSRFVGYDVWPRLGYDGLIPGVVRERLPDAFRGIQSVLDLVLAPGGAQWWRRHGRGFEATFDLRDGGRSLDVLAAYTAEKGIRI